MTAKTTKFFESSTPLLLSAQTGNEVTNTGFLTNGQTATPPMDFLSYPFRKPVMIDEIRFTLLATGGGNIMNHGAYVFVKFMLGSMYLMRDPVPVASLASFMSLEDEQSSVGNYDDGYSSVSHYRWRLPYPLYVSAGQYLMPIFSRNDPTGKTIDTSVNVMVTYAGRTVPPNQPLPRVIPVPYVAPFVTPLAPDGGYAQSNERHLFNPFDRPLQVQRMTGRYYVFEEAAPNVVSQIRLQTGITGGPSNAQNLTVRINDSWGGKMVNNFTGPADVWDIQRAAWTYDTVMPAKGMYEVQAWNLPSSAAANTQLAIAMIGTREETL